MTHISLDNDNVIELKTCTKCMKTKPLDEFNKGAIWGTRRAACKECLRKYIKEKRLLKVTKTVK